jgi:hypothetical protein
MVRVGKTTGQSSCLYAAAILAGGSSSCRGDGPKPAESAEWERIVRSRAKEMGEEREEDAATPGTYSHRRSGGGVGGRGASTGHEFHGEGAAGP